MYNTESVSVLWTYKKLHSISSSILKNVHRYQSDRAYFYMARLVFSLLFGVFMIFYIMFMCSYFYKLARAVTIHITHISNSTKHDCATQKLLNSSGYYGLNSCDMYKHKEADYFALFYFVIGFVLIVLYFFILVALFKQAFPRYSSRVYTELHYPLPQARQL